MKKILSINSLLPMIIILFVIILGSCINEPPIINGKIPFIVNKITLLNNGLCAYRGSKEGITDDILVNNPVIIGPAGLYNIGDTIKLCK